MLTVFGSVLGFLGVALGAFGAHGMEGRLTPESKGWWETATLYLLVHAVAILATGLSGKTGLFATGGWAMGLGAIIFSGTLYAMAFGGPRWFGAITPIGGVALLIGWALLAFAALKF
ncbi:DUF423 domain-containing protein [Henriciella aquimarina]|uniref:DUF423 domain-containing protein n=1 Tax=Henriciella aquimarina TaxID=545261 RepID=UPI0009FBF647|nr:DUF423 domain-containing protein [Henriciella aquimarina]